MVSRSSIVSMIYLPLLVGLCVPCPGLGLDPARHGRLQRYNTGTQQPRQPRAAGRDKEGHSRHVYRISGMMHVVNIPFQHGLGEPKI